MFDEGPEIELTRALRGCRKSVGGVLMIFF